VTTFIKVQSYVQRSAKFKPIFRQWQGQGASCTLPYTYTHPDVKQRVLLEYFYTIQEKAQAQGLRVRLPTFSYLLTTKQNKHEAANHSRENLFTNWNYRIVIVHLTN